MKYSKNTKIIIKKYTQQLQDRGYFWGRRGEKWDMGKGRGTIETWTVTEIIFLKKKSRQT